MDSLKLKFEDCNGMKVTMARITKAEFEKVLALEKISIALDEELVVSHIGTFTLGDDPKEALNKLAVYNQELGGYFAKEKTNE